MLLPWRYFIHHVYLASGEAIVLSSQSKYIGCYTILPGKLSGLISRMIVVCGRTSLLSRVSVFSKTVNLPQIICLTQINNLRLESEMGLQMSPGSLFRNKLDEFDVRHSRLFRSLINSPGCSYTDDLISVNNIT